MPVSSTVAAILVPHWPAPARVRAAVTTRRMPGTSQAPFDTFNLGAHCGDDPVAVAANRTALVGLLNLPREPRWLRQVHGTDVVSFDAAAPGGDTPCADASLTHAPGVVLAVLTADCLPLLVCTDDGSGVAAIHAGWRGLAAGVIERCIGKLHTPRERLMVWLGPAIGARSYEVGDEVRETFLARSAHDAQAFAPTRPGHWHCDLYALARNRLAALGIDRVHGGGFDTCVDARFYSHRRDRIGGRFASLIWLAEG
ncbi:MAG: peptidoglycan editing factor PgeF [Rudaea sp.]|uniref:peptidoglycan editing factor PgeF n=1 Tax=Rudaea sp. TaxID=2136325 RepID=UPI0039E31C31